MLVPPTSVPTPIATLISFLFNIRYLLLMCGPSIFSH
jgi:hypothetical protein